MVKKKAVKKKVKLEDLPVPVLATLALVKLAPLNLDFGREDLNLMRDKINEIVAQHG